MEDHHSRLEMVAVVYILLEGGRHSLGIVVVACILVEVDHHNLGIGVVGCTLLGVGESLRSWWEVDRWLGQREVHHTPPLERVMTRGC